MSSTLLIVILAGSGYAETLHTAADFLVEVGLSDLEKGYKESAAHEFRKAILLNPDHPKAYRYLKALNEELDENHAIELEDLAFQIREYKQRVARLKAQRNHIEDKFLKLQLDQKQMRDALAQKDEKVRDLPKQFDRKEDVKFVKVTNIPSPPEQHTFRNPKYDVLVEQSLYFHDKYDELEKKYSRLKMTSSGHFSYQDKLIHVLEDLLNIREESMEDIKDELIYKQIDLVEAEKDLLYKLNELIDMSESVSLYQEQLKDREVIIQEKNLDMEHLTEELKEARQTNQQPAS